MTKFIVGVTYGIDGITVIVVTVSFESSSTDFRIVLIVLDSFSMFSASSYDALYGARFGDGDVDLVYRISVIISISVNR